MKYLTYLIITLAFLSLIAYVIWLTDNPMWILMVFFAPMFKDLLRGSDDDDDDEPNKNAQLNG